MKNETVGAFKTQYRDVRGEGIVLEFRRQEHPYLRNPRSASGRLGIPPPLGVVQE